MTDWKTIEPRVAEWAALFEELQGQLEIIRLYEQPLPDSTTQQMKHASVRMHQIMSNIIKELAE